MSTSNGKPHTGVLIVNADDWGASQEATDRIFDCIQAESVSSASAMVFMEDSERAADIARTHGVDTGLHLNLTAPFTAKSVSSELQEHQGRIASRLRQGRFSQAFWHRDLTKSFQYVVSAQLAEYARLYGNTPARLDGHHHMHLCSNVLWGGLLPPGIIVRRNFTFEAGEKSLANRYYRQIVDRKLAKGQRLTDMFFSLPPMEPASRLERIFSLARQFAVEVETHPATTAEYRFLLDGEIFRHAGDVPIAPRYALPSATAA